MSLDHIQLPAITIQQLYKNSLISSPEKENHGKNETGLKFLGGNKRGIILLVENKEATYLPGVLLDFLMEILTACKLSMDDVALVNIAKYKNFHYNEIVNQLDPKVFIVFGLSLSAIGLPFTIPEFQLQVFDKITYLSAPPINQLQADKELKRSLWSSLKQIFSI
jgi:hypothetical protein